MSVIVQTGKTSVTGSVQVNNSGLSTPSANQTLINITNSILSAFGECSANTLYTVTAGKTLYITHIYISSAAANGGHIMDNATDLLGMNIAVSPFTYQATFQTPLKFSTSVVYYNINATNVLWNIIGWEE